MTTTPYGRRPPVQWHDETTPSPAAARDETHMHPDDQRGHGWGHRLMMVVCCVPMLLVVIALVVSGAAGAGAILYALLCTAMMAAMMFMMPGHKH